MVSIIINIICLCKNMYFSMTGDWITSKPFEALMGIFTSSLAIASACGFLFALGIPFISQV